MVFLFIYLPKQVNFTPLGVGLVGVGVQIYSFSSMKVKKSMLNMIERHIITLERQISKK
jgi:hypothetical protein